jgi:four helix bundle protein
MSGIKSYEDFLVFQRSYKISLEIHKFSLELPKIEQYGLGDQMRKASKSVCVNFTEGFAKQSYSRLEFRKYLIISVGSANEMLIWIKYCRDLEYLSIEQYEDWNKEYIEIAKMLSKLVKNQTDRKT